MEVVGIASGGVATRAICISCSADVIEVQIMKDGLVLGAIVEKQIRRAGLPVAWHPEWNYAIGQLSLL